MLEVHISYREFYHGYQLGLGFFAVEHTVLLLAKLKTGFRRCRQTCFCCLLLLARNVLVERERSASLLLMTERRLHKKKSTRSECFSALRSRILGSSRAGKYVGMAQKIIESRKEKEILCGAPYKSHTHTRGPLHEH